MADKDRVKCNVCEKITEIFENIKTLINRYYNDYSYTIGELNNDIDKLEKKYGGSQQ